MSKNLEELCEENIKAMEKAIKVGEEVSKTCKTITQEPTVAIYNIQQAYTYLAAGVKPLTYFPDKHTKRICFIFTKRETKNLYEQWLKHEI